MGYLMHHAIVVTSRNDDDLMAAWGKAQRIFGCKIPGSPRTFDELVSPIIPTIVNGGGSFFIAPDGSKEGWDTSDCGDDLRKQFCDELADSSLMVEWCELIVGGDDSIYRIERSAEEPGDDEPSHNASSSEARR